MSAEYPWSWTDAVVTTWWKLDSLIGSLLKDGPYVIPKSAVKSIKILLLGQGCTKQSCWNPKVCIFFCLNTMEGNIKIVWCIQVLQLRIWWIHWCNITAVLEWSMWIYMPTTRRHLTSVMERCCACWAAAGVPERWSLSQFMDVSALMHDKDVQIFGPMAARLKESRYYREL